MIQQTVKLVSLLVLQDGGQLYVSVAMTPSPEEPNFRPKNVGRGRPCIVSFSRRNLLPSCPPTTSSWGQLRIWVIVAQFTSLVASRVSILYRCVVTCIWRLPWRVRILILMRCLGAASGFSRVWKWIQLQLHCNLFRCRGGGWTGFFFVIMAGQCCQCDHGRCEGCRAELLNTEPFHWNTHCWSNILQLWMGRTVNKWNSRVVHCKWHFSRVQEVCPKLFRIWWLAMQGSSVKSVLLRVLDLELFIYKIGGLPLSLVKIYYLSWQLPQLNRQGFLNYSGVEDLVCNSTLYNNYMTDDILHILAIRIQLILQKSINHHLELYQKTPW